MHTCKHRKKTDLGHAVKELKGRLVVPGGLAVLLAHLRVVVDDWLVHPFTKREGEKTCIYTHIYRR